MAPGVSSADVAVVGGGVIGAACARAASRAGLRVVLLEPGPAPGAATPASAGMLAAQIDPGDDPGRALGVRGRALYTDLAPALKDTTGIDIGLWLPGIVSVALTDADAAALRDDVARQRQAGLRADWLDPADVRERWPGLSDECRGALYAPEDGALDPPALTRALLADARRLGATIVTERVDQIVIAANRATGVATHTTTWSTGHTVIAAGAWSSPLAGMSPALPVEPVRGQLVASAWPATVPRGIFFHHHSYVLARGERAVVGSTMEHVGLDHRTTEEGVAQILTEARRLLPALDPLPVERAWAGLRPVTPDGRPIVGPDPRLAGLWYATGHGRSGILLAALTGDVIADLLTTGSTPEDIASWGPQRFG